MLTADKLRELLHYDPATGIFTWRVKRRAQTPAGTVAGCVANHGYFQIHVAGTRYLAHRLAWLYVHGRWPTKLIDHANNIRTDNRFHNLREADRSKNAANAKISKVNSTGLKGAQRYKDRFKTSILHRHLGVFDTAQEAHEAYCAAARKIYGEFARTE